MNKKGNLIVVALVFVALFVILLIGLVLVLTSSILNFVFDEVTPIFSDLGVIGDSNMTEITSYTIEPVNTAVQSLTWMTGVLYMMLIIVSLAIVLIFREATSKWTIGFYVLFVLILIMGSMLVSNTYEDLYTGTDDISTRMQEHTLLSFMIIHAPSIFTIIGFVVGIILYSNLQMEEQYY